MSNWEVRETLGRNNSWPYRHQACCPHSIPAMLVSPLWPPHEYRSGSCLKWSAVSHLASPEVCPPPNHPPARPSSSARLLDKSLKVTSRSPTHPSSDIHGVERKQRLLRLALCFVIGRGPHPWVQESPGCSIPQPVLGDSSGRGGSETLGQVSPRKSSQDCKPRAPALPAPPRAPPHPPYTLTPGSPLPLMSFSPAPILLSRSPGHFLPLQPCQIPTRPPAAL